MTTTNKTESHEQMVPGVVHIAHLHTAAPTTTKSSTRSSPNTDLAMTTTTLWRGLATFLQALSYNEPKLHPTFLLPHLDIANT